MKKASKAIAFAMASAMAVSMAACGGSASSSASGATTEDSASATGNGSYDQVTYDGIPGDPNTPHRTIWPWISVFVDDNDQPCRTFELTNKSTKYLIYSGTDEQEHMLLRHPAATIL